MAAVPAALDRAPLAPCIAEAKELYKTDRTLANTDVSEKEADLHGRMMMEVKHGGQYLVLQAHLNATATDVLRVIEGSHGVVRHRKVHNWLKDSLHEDAANPKL